MKAAGAAVGATAVVTTRTAPSTAPHSPTILAVPRVPVPRVPDPRVRIPRLWRIEQIIASLVRMRRPAAVRTAIGPSKQSGQPERVLHGLGGSRGPHDGVDGLALPDELPRVEPDDGDTRLQRQ